MFISPVLMHLPCCVPPCLQVGRQGPLAGIIPSCFIIDTLTPEVITSILANDKLLGEMRLVGNPCFMAQPPSLEIGGLLGHLFRIKWVLACRAPQATCAAVLLSPFVH